MQYTIMENAPEITGLHTRLVLAITPTIIEKHIFRKKESSLVVWGDGSKWYKLPHFSKCSRYEDDKITSSFDEYTYIRYGQIEYDKVVEAKRKEAEHAETLKEAELQTFFAKIYKKIEKMKWGP